MTIATDVSRNDYVGTGLVATYPYGFKVFDESDLFVIKELAGVESVLVLNVDYTVTGVGNDGGGNVVLTANLADQAALTIRRVVNVVQETDIKNQKTYFPDQLENALDYLCMIDLQQEDGIARSFKLPETEAGDPEFTTLPDAAERASQFFGFDAQGRPIAGVPSGALGPVSAFVQTLLDDATAVIFRQTLLLDKKGADIASAATINLDSSTGDLIDITGSTTITAITLAEGVEKTLRLTGAPLITHGASLECPGSVSIQGFAGDRLRVRGYAAGVVRVMEYTPHEQGILSKVVTTAGDLLVATAARTVARLAVGAAGAFLMSDPAPAAKLSYVRLGAGDARQSVLSCVLDSNGYANSLAAGSGLALNLDASPTPLVIAFASGFGAAGAQDLVATVSADSTGAVSSLSASNTTYVYADWASLSTVTWDKTLVPPQYGYVFDRAQNSLLHFDGTDASTTIIDDFGNTWTAAGNAQIDTAQFKFGTSSGLLDGTGDYFESTNFTTLGDGSWEESVWFRANATSAVHAILSAENATGFGVVLDLDHNAGTRRLRLTLSSNGTSNDIASGSAGAATISLATWYKARIVCDALGGTYRVYLSNNGAAESQDISVSSSARICAITKKRLGRNAQAGFSDFNGWVDEYRGIRAATVTGTETPKASAFTVNETGQLINWFSVPEMKMYEVTSASGTAGVNPGMTAKNRVFVAEADTSGAAVTAVRNYALKAKYDSGQIAFFTAATATVKNHNIGVRPDQVKAYLINITTDLGWIPGDRVEVPDLEVNSGASSLNAVIGVDRNTIRVNIATSGITLLGKTSPGASTGVTGSSWNGRIIADRGW